MKKNEENKIFNHLTKYLSNELTNQEKLDIEQSIENAEEQKLFIEMKKDIENMDGLKYMHEEETNIAWDKLQSRIQQEEEINTVSFLNRINFSYSNVLKFAASIVVLLGLSWLTFNVYKSQLNETIETFTNKTEVTLPDGTQVTLNAYTKLSYPKKFNSDVRRVVLSGEAFFDVSRNPEKPFIIEAKDTEIKVLGTSFNVFARDNIKGVDVVVTTGTVRLSSKTNKSESIILSVGETGNLKRNKALKTKITDINYLSWKTQIIDFRNSPLNKVIEVLNKTYTANIKLDNPTIGNFKLTSKYDHINLDTIIKTVCITFDLQREDKNGQIILKKSNN